MRTITDHKVNGLNEAIEITAMDAPGAGGSNHVYRLALFKDGHSIDQDTTIVFQNGPIKTPDDINGLSNEALLAVLIDRMRGFQFKRKDTGDFNPNSLGPFACRENAVALVRLEEALMWLQKRTSDRIARGVEGTHNT